MELRTFDFRKGKLSHLLLNHYFCLIYLLTWGCKVAIKKLVDRRITRILQMMRFFGLSLWVPGEMLTCVHLLFFWWLQDRICRMRVYQEESNSQISSASVSLQMQASLPASGLSLVGFSQREDEERNPRGQPWGEALTEGLTVLRRTHPVCFADRLTWDLTQGF